MFYDAKYNLAPFEITCDSFCLLCLNHVKFYFCLGQLLQKQIGVCVLFEIYTSIDSYLAGWRIVKSEIELLMIALLGFLAIF